MLTWTTSQCMSIRDTLLRDIHGLDHGQLDHNVSRRVTRIGLPLSALVLLKPVCSRLRGFHLVMSLSEQFDLDIRIAEALHH